MLSMRLRRKSNLRQLVAVEAEEAEVVETAVEAEPVEEPVESQRLQSKSLLKQRLKLNKADVPKTLEIILAAIP